MNKTIIASALFLLLSPLVFAYDFRNVNWGMSYEEVKERETEAEVDSLDEQGHEFQMYYIVLDGEEIEMTYHFESDKLRMVSYGLREYFESPLEKALIDFNHYWDYFQKLYGEAPFKSYLHEDDFVRVVEWHSGKMEMSLFFSHNESNNLGGLTMFFKRGD